MTPDDPRPDDPRPDDPDTPSDPDTEHTVDRLPVDPDLERGEDAGGRARPAHLHSRFLLLVAIGGAIGTALRELLSAALPPASGFPVGILVINVTGALILAALLEALAHAGEDVGARRVVRLLVGTGVMGGYTTYSALAVDSAHLVGSGAAAVGILYALITVVAGAAASAAGILGMSALLGARTARREGASA